MTTCPDESELERYHAGELDQARALEVRGHLASCDECAKRDAELLGEYGDLAKRVRELRPVVRLDDSADTVKSPAAARPTHEDSHAHIPEIDGYKVVRELHRGGQGVVYQAIETATKRKVAIKLLLHGQYASASDRKRFEREIGLAANLRHPNIIAIFHSGETHDGRPYFVMDYVRNRPLNEYVRDQKLTLEQVLRLFATICEAVNYAHQRGVIHRDLKPSNILVDTEGQPRVLDFGLAKTLAGGDASLMSITGQVMGTPAYMSPEQARGNPDELDTRTDLYSLGVVLYELLTGCFPYPVTGQLAEVLHHITDTPPTPPTRSWTVGGGVAARGTRRVRAGRCPIDDEVQTIILRLLSKERSRRYQSASELAGDIRHYLAGEPIQAKRDSGWYVLKKAIHRQRFKLGTVAAFILVVLVAASAYSYRVGAEREARLAAQQQLLDERAAHLEDREQLTRTLVALGGERGLSGPEHEAAERLLESLAERMRKGRLSADEVNDIARLLITVGVAGRRLTKQGVDPALGVSILPRRGLTLPGVAMVVAVSATLDDDMVLDRQSVFLPSDRNSAYSWSIQSDNALNEKGLHRLTGNVQIRFADAPAREEYADARASDQTFREWLRGLPTFAECTLPIPALEFTVSDAVTEIPIEIEDEELAAATVDRIHVLGLRWGALDGERADTDAGRAWWLEMQLDRQFSYLAFALELHDSDGQLLADGRLVATPQGEPATFSGGYHVQRRTPSGRQTHTFRLPLTEGVKLGTDGRPLFTDPVTITFRSSRTVAKAAAEVDAYLAATITKTVTVGEDQPE